MTGLDWKSDSAATVIHPFRKGNGRIHLNGTGGGNFSKTRSKKLIRGFRQSVNEFEIHTLRSIVRSDVHALLALEDGRYFEGESFGATGTRVGEICFNTAMTGYQEVLTDPSYRGQIVAMTYPLIGNYGIN